MRAFLGRAHAQKPYCCCFASAFVPISDENRDGGRAFSRYWRVKPAPFRGSGPHSPPRRRTRGRRSDLSLPLARKERFQESLWPGNCQPRLAFRTNPANCRMAGLPLRLSPFKHTYRGVLAEPFNNTKKGRLGQTNFTRPYGFGFEFQPQAAYLPLLVVLRPVVHHIVSFGSLKQAGVRIAANDIGHIGGLCSQPRIVMELAHDDP